MRDVSCRKARPVPVGACSRPGELCLVPRPARLEQRADAGRKTADPLSAVPHREPASGDHLREHASQREQEQPGRRALVRQLPRDDSWFESSVRRGLLQVREEDAMRTRTMILIGALLLASTALAAAQDSGTTASSAKAQTNAAVPTQGAPAARPSP